MNQQEQRELLESLAAGFVSRMGNNTGSALSMGSFLHQQRVAGISDKDFRAKIKALGVTPPSGSRMSVYRSAYLAWHDTSTSQWHVEWAELLKFSIDTLYHAGRMIGRLDENDNLITPEHALALAGSLNDQQLRQLVSRYSKPRGAEQAEGDASGDAKGDSGLRSLTMSVDAYEALGEFAERLARVIGVNEVSKSKSLLFALEQVNTLDDDSLDYLWREAHGEVSEEEAAEVHTLVLDVEEGA